MGRIKFFVLIPAVSLLSLNAKIVLAQGNKPIQGLAVETAVNREEAKPAISVESETQWLWGEVSSVDVQNNEITVNYLDYETDNEKEIKIGVDNKTNYEYVKSLNDIKVHDTISIDYIVTADGKHIAKNISIEKPEETSLPQKESAQESLKPDSEAPAKTP